MIYFCCESELHRFFLMASIIWALEQGLDIAQECEHWRAQWFGILSWWLLSSSSSSSSIIYFERHLMLMKWCWNGNLDQYDHHHICLWSGARQKLSYSIAQAYKGSFFVFPGCFCTLHIFFRRFRHCQNKAALRWTCGSCSVVEQERIVGDSAGGWEEVEQNLHPGVRFQPPSILSIEYSMPSIWLDIFIQYHG